MCSVRDRMRQWLSIRVRIFLNSLRSLLVGVSSINFLFPQKHPSLHDASSSSTTCLLFIEYLLENIHDSTRSLFTVPSSFDSLILSLIFHLLFPSSLPSSLPSSFPSSPPSHFNYEDGWVTQACFFPGFSFSFSLHTLLVYSQKEEKSIINYLCN